MLNDAHCHFFSARFFETLAKQKGLPAETDAAAALTAQLEWDAPGAPEVLADRWVAELDKHQVGRAALIASVPGDEDSVAIAVARHPARFVGYFMIDPTADGALDRLAGDAGQTGHALRVPLPRHAPLRAPRRARAARRRTAGASAGDGAVRALRHVVGRRAQETRVAEPLRDALRRSAAPAAGRHDLSGASDHRSALRRRHVPRGADARGCLSERASRYVQLERLDEISPRADASDRLPQALAVAGPDRLLFGTDSSFFPRGWQRAIHEQQRSALEGLAADESVMGRIFGGNFDRLFPLAA